MSRKSVGLALVLGGVLSAWTLPAVHAQNLLTNPNFDLNSDLTPWAWSGAFAPPPCDYYPYSPPYYACFTDPNSTTGEWGNDLTGALYQLVYVPPNATSITISYRYRVGTTETYQGYPRAAYDHFYVRLWSLSWDFLEELGAYSNLDSVPIPGGPYQPASFNRTRYAGQYIYLSFQGQTDGDHPSTFHIDNVSVIPTIQTTGACCFADGSCQSLTYTNCANLGGTRWSENVACASGNCPQPPCTDSQCAPCQRCQDNVCAPVQCGSCQECDNNHGCTNYQCCSNSGCSACEKCQNNTCVPVSCPGQRCDNNHGCEPIPGDTIPPTTPSGLTAAPVSTNEVDLSWQASTDTGGSGLAGYKVYRDGSGPIAYPSGTTYPDSGLSPSTQYCYRVSAYDGAGNESSQGNQACATTPVEVALQIEPSGGLAAAGNQGGPFLSDRKIFTVRNTSNQEIRWSVRSEGKRWVTIRPTSGNLSPSGSTVVTVALNGDAYWVAPGAHTDVVDFVNLSTATVEASRPIALDVRAGGQPLRRLQTVVLDFDIDAPFQMTGEVNRWIGCYPARSPGSTPHIDPASPALDCLLPPFGKTFQDFREDIRSFVSLAYAGFGVEIVLSSDEATLPRSAQSPVYFALDSVVSGCAAAATNAVDHCNLNPTDDALIYVTNTCDYMSTVDDAAVSAIHEIGHLLGLSHTKPDVGQWMYANVEDPASTFVGEPVHLDNFPRILGGDLMTENDRFALYQVLGAANRVDVGTPGTFNLLFAPACLETYLISLSFNWSVAGTLPNLKAIIWHGSDVARVVPLISEAAHLDADAESPVLRFSLPVGASEAVSVEGSSPGSVEPDIFAYFAELHSDTIVDLDPSAGSLGPAVGDPSVSVSGSLIRIAGETVEAVAGLQANSSKLGDFDLDGDVDRNDAGSLAMNLSGPQQQSTNANAARVDMDGDGDVDLHDLFEMEARMTRCFVNCVNPGACCFGDGGCFVLHDSECSQKGGQFAGEGTDCLDWLTCRGACCVSDQCQAQHTQFSCAERSGTYQGNGTTCEDLNIACPLTGGACCLGLTDCRDDHDGETCAAYGGAFLGVGTFCYAYCCNPPSQDGACCFTDGGCVEGCRTSCESTGGVFQGEGAPCNLGSCGGGSCCLPDGSCTFVTEALCAAQGGTFFGIGSSNCYDGSSCSGACCVSLSTCIDRQSPADCVQRFQGTFQGIGTTCLDNGLACADGAGACCYYGSCLDDWTEFMCVFNTGDYRGDGTRCENVNCTVFTGACPSEGDCCVPHRSPGCADESCCRGVCDLDPACCLASPLGAWDELCATEAVRICGSGDGAYCAHCPGVERCCNEHRSPGCDDETCCEAVCARDPYCCEVSWDSLCVGLVANLCASPCP